MFSNHDELVKAAYNVLLDRDPEPGGLKYWSSALQNGLRKEEFLRAFLHSLEFREKMGSIDELGKYADVDLVIPIKGCRLQVPSADLSLVPYLLDYRCWEPHVSRYLTLNLRSADVFMDVGANLGYYTVLCAPLVKRVIAFEPVCISHQYCKTNIALNNLSNVDLYKCGLWHGETNTRIRIDRSSMMGAFISSNDGSATEGESIRCVSLDDLIRRGELQLSRLNVVKMDIEGAEASALKGMLQTIEQFRPKILMELNRPTLERFGKTIDDIWNFFSNVSYRIKAFEQWKETDPKPVDTLEDLKTLCPPDSLIDVLAEAL